MCGDIGKGTQWMGSFLNVAMLSDSKQVIEEVRN